MLSLHEFVRFSELRFARWNEFDLKRGIWKIPDIRPVLGRVPFSTRSTDGQGHSRRTVTATGSALA